MPPAKTEVALQFSDCCAAEVALQHWLFCSADVIFTKSCAAASEKLQCNIGIAALQESGAFLLLSCGFQAPAFRHPRLGPADLKLFVRSPCGLCHSKSFLVPDNMNFKGNPYGPILSCLVFKDNLHELMALKLCQKSPPRRVHGWLCNFDSRRV